MEKLEWHIEQIAWNEMIPFEKNARKIKAANKKKLLESVEEFGMAVTPTLDADNVIVGGHQRRQLMVESGRGTELTDVKKPNRKLTEEEFKKLNLLLNSNKYAGEYDVEMLNKYFSEFTFEDYGIEIPDFEKAIDAIDEQMQEPEMPIVPKFSEKYTAFVIVCENEIDANHIAEKLQLQEGECYKSSKVGRMNVVNAKQFIEAWK